MDNSKGAYYSQQQIKDEVLMRVNLARLENRIIQGNYYNAETDCGCAVGIVVHSGNHQAYADEFNIPAELAIMKDIIHERLADGSYQTWPGRFLSAVPVGADLSLVFWQLIHRMIADETHGMIALVKDNDLKDLFITASALFVRKAQGLTVVADEWITVTNSALALALAPVRALALALARALARARDPALALALARALATAPDFAPDFDRDQFYEWLANQLCELLAAAPLVANVRF